MCEGNEWIGHIEERIKASNHLIELQKGNTKISHKVHLELVNNSTTLLLMNRKSLLDKCITTEQASNDMSKIELVQSINLQNELKHLTKNSLLENYESLPINKGRKKKEIIQLILESQINHH